MANDNFAQLQLLWGASFNYTLSESNGASYWRKYVNDERCNFEIFLQAVEKYATEYGRDREAGYHPQPPTFQQVKARYLALKALSEEERAQAKYGKGASGCGCCFGEGWVTVLSSKWDDKNWPPDYRYIHDDQYPGCEVTLCPICHAEAYKEFERRHRVEARSVPVTIGPAHEARKLIADYLPGVAVPGKEFLYELMRRAARRQSEDLDQEFPA